MAKYVAELKKELATAKRQKALALRREDHWGANKWRSRIADLESKIKLSEEDK